MLGGLGPAGLCLAAAWATGEQGWVLHWLRWAAAIAAHKAGPLHGMTAASLVVIPMSLREANDFVEQFHRHNGRTSRDGGKFAIGASADEGLLGVAIVGRPVARLLDDSFTAEVLRVCVAPDLAPRNNVCSFLYGRCWRIWQAMGGLRMVTYTLPAEGGASLRGVGWRLIGESKPGTGWDRALRRRDWQPIYGQMKLRWEVAA